MLVNTLTHNLQTVCLDMSFVAIILGKKQIRDNTALHPAAHAEWFNYRVPLQYSSRNLAT